MSALVEVREAARTYRQGARTVTALDRVSLRIEAGRMVAVVGRSGSGKTTLLNLIGGLDRPTSGTVLYRGQVVHRMSERQLTLWRRRELGFVFQAFALVPSLTAIENVELSLHLAGVPHRERRRRALQALAQVGLGKRGRQVSLELSGGEQQRVAIARAMAHKPRLIIADEPTGGLDFKTGRMILDMLRQAVDEEGIAILTATHDPVVQEYADETYALEDGRLLTA